MRHTGRYILLSLLVVALVSSVSCTCSKGTQPISKTTAPSLISTPTTGGQPSPTSAAPKPTATSTGALLPGMPDIADMKSLPSYRLSIMTKQVDGADSVSYMKYEYVRDQKAEHAWTEDASGKITEVYIKIGDKTWIWIMGRWVEQPQQTTPTQSMPSDLASQFKKVQEDVKNSKGRFDKKGTETVNNVRCIRYEFEYSVTTDMPNLAKGGTTKIDEHSTGEFWISDQSGLPAVVIKTKNRSEITMAGRKTVMDFESNLTDIGAPITINPPSGAFVPPTGPPSTGGTTPPAIPTTKPTPTPTPTPKKTNEPVPSPTGGTPTFSDGFDGKWDARMTWTDPNGDVKYNFTAHPGFLRLTVPDDNDLAGVTNYDAPRLLIPQGGNFTIETLVEFDPKETYQGAGLLLWQNEDTFFRLEFSFGGMGGGAKNVAFCIQEGGGLGLVSSVELPNTMNRIELRLQRSGSQCIAWYRQVGGTWQKVGNAELKLNATVNVGITQVTQYTSSAISADFDYFRVYVP